MTRKIREFVAKKTEFYIKEADERAHQKERNVAELVNQKEEIKLKHDEDEKEIERLHQLID